MIRWLAVALVALVACGGSPRTPVPEGPPPASAPVGDHGVDVANLNAQLPPYLASLGGGSPLRALSGYVLVAQHDQVLYGQGFGLADRANQRVATADTSFRVGSVTKQFTAAAILRLEQDGKLAVEDKVSKHLPDYPGPGKDVTIHQLLTHTAGIPSYTELDKLMERRAEPITVHDLLAMFWNLPLEFAPGTKFSYSNSGYAILGAIIERVSGVPYRRYLEDHLFRPAKLAHTEVGDAAGAADRAEGYKIAQHALIPAHAIDMSLPFAAGAVRSTASDLVRWHRALSGDAILSAGERDKLYRVERDKYAYAWVVDEVAGHRVVWHNGGIDGFGTSYWRVPDADLVVVAWTNVEGVAIDPVSKAAVEAALGGKLEPQAPDKPGTLDRALVERVAGTYTLTDDSKAKLTALGAPPKMIDAVLTITLTATTDGIAMKPAGQGMLELAPSTDGSFYNADLDVRIRADVPASGLVTSVSLEQRKIKMTYQR
jgi:CubicO group peptidase (beta-lactamase class C family)